MGINLAIQDAVAAANLLAGPLREGRVTEALLERVQRRREFPTRVTQRLQVNAHKGLEYVFRHPGPLQAPWQLKVVMRLPGLQHIAARVIGIGVRPEHIRDPETRPAAPRSLRRMAVFAGILAGVVVIAVRGMSSSRRT